MSTDVRGRPWLTVAEATPGVTVRCDEGFTCIRPRSLRVIQQADDGLWIQCRCGRHYLDGQLDFDGGQFYVGLYPRAQS